MGKSFFSKRPQYKGMDSEQELRWEELRSLFVGDEKVQLQKLQEFLGNPENFAKEISKVLPDAINVARERSEELTESLTEAMLPIIEEAIRRSTERSVKPLSEGLFPIIGPAIRKAVADTFRKMNQTVNNTLGNTLSWKGIKWRYESWKTGKPFIEIVIKNTMLFQVKQIFLIHKETGLLLQHVNADFGAIEDADMISAMLKAIQDFVQDSFKKDEDLAKIEFGEHSIWIEQGGRAILAAVIYGTPPLNVRDTFKDALEKIHIDFAKELREFEGDVRAFLEDTHQIDSCLLSQELEENKKTPISKYIIIGIITILSLYWILYNAYESYRWNSYLDELHHQKGIIITGEGNENGKFFIKGMLEPTSPDPEKLLTNFGFLTHEVNSKWEYYQSLEPEYILERTRKLIKPPKTVSLEWNKSTLYIKGEAEMEWIEESKNLLANVWEIREINTENLQDISLINLQKTLNQIQEIHFLFKSGGTEILPEQYYELDSLGNFVKRAVKLAQKNHKNIHIYVKGFSDSIGTNATNLQLSQKRADIVYRYLLGIGVPHQFLSKEGKGFQPSDTLTSLDQQRRVALQISLTEK